MYKSQLGYFRLSLLFSICIFLTSCACTNQNEVKEVASTAFGVGTWQGYSVSIWDSNWSYSYEITLYNDGSAEGTIIDHGPAGDTRRYGIGRWHRSSASFGDKRYFWTDVLIDDGDMEHRFYVDSQGGVYAPFGRPVWQAMRDDSPIFRFVQK